MSDNVHNPKYYQGRNGLEAIDVLRNFMSDEQFDGYHLGNLLKYLIRYSKKNGIEDLEKAKVHMDWLIKKEKIMMLQQKVWKAVDSKLEVFAKTKELVEGNNDQ